MPGQHHPIDIHRRIVELTDAGASFAVGVVLRADGSTPQKIGVKAAIDAGGKIYGTLGGGRVEAQAQERAIEACRSRQPTVFDVDLGHSYSWDAGAICGGSMRILLDPAAARHRAACLQAAEALERRERGVLLTTVRAAEETSVAVQWLPEEAVPTFREFPGAEALRKCLAREAAAHYRDESQPAGAASEVLVEPVLPRPVLLIAGGGHVGQAVAVDAVRLGFDVTVLDDRPEFTNPELFPPGVKTLCGDTSAETAAFPVAADTYVVIVTRDHQHDAKTLAACIRRPAAYVGMIGSRRKVALMRRSFLESGLATQEEFDRVFAPVGMDIGAVTVPEIAASIAAQLVAVRRKGREAANLGRMVLT